MQPLPRAPEAPPLKAMSLVAKCRARRPATSAGDQTASLPGGVALRGFDYYDPREISIHVEGQRKRLRESSAEQLSTVVYAAGEQPLRDPKIVGRRGHEAPSSQRACFQAAARTLSI